MNELVLIGDMQAFSHAITAENRCQREIDVIQTRFRTKSVTAKGYFVDKIRTVMSRE